MDEFSMARNQGAKMISPDLAMRIIGVQRRVICDIGVATRAQYICSAVQSAPHCHVRLMPKREGALRRPEVALETSYL